MSLSKVLPFYLVVLLLKNVSTFTVTRKIQRRWGFGINEGKSAIQKMGHDNSCDRWSLALSSKPMQDSTSTQVLYQKVLKPPGNLPDMLFLGHLVEYLESRFKLPNNLPMIYETFPGDEAKRTILAWDSPLSPLPEATRMEVEVVGIYTDKKEKKKSSGTHSVPNMAMVVVRKSSSPGSSIPPMMQNLFQDSEKRIFKSLDRGLEDFIAGKINFDEKQQKPGVPNNIKTAQEAIEAELVDSIPEHNSASGDPKDVVFDAYATSEDGESSKSARMGTTSKNQGDAKELSSAASKKQVEPATLSRSKQASRVKGSTTKDSRDNSLSDDAKVVEDFAVAAARKMAKKRRIAKKQQPEDFAVAAARKVAAKRKLERKSQKFQTKKTPREIIKGQSNVPPSPVQLEEAPAMPSLESFKIPDYMGKDRAFRTTISRPADRKRREKQRKVAHDEQSTQTSVTSGNVVETKDPKKKNATRSFNTVQTKELKEGSIKKKNAATEQLTASIEKTRKLNVNVIDAKEDGASPLDNFQSDSKDVLKKSSMPSREEMEIEVMKAAQNVMDEMAEQGEDMTPEELLKDVLKFGEEKEAEEKTGSGFVSGAFEKAKELMRERHQQMQSRNDEGRQFKEMTKPVQPTPNIVGQNELELSAEEELRQMFQAGERIADGRITETVEQKGEISKQETTEEDIDLLISQDRTISKFARSLDEGLAELELTINKSPGEENDGPRQNSIFDVMSGPEVYNPNVDLGAVNYPGALPGRKELKLPGELSEAMKQAEFAVDILTNMKVIEMEDAAGNKKFQYLAGDKEITQEQVDKLRTVVVEAVEIGLIKDPVNLMAESSRLQSLVDELWDQPQERFRDIAENYKDLLLSDNFVDLMKNRLEKMAQRDLDALRRDDESLREPHQRERDILGQLVGYSQLLVKEARALSAALEAQQLEVVRSICQVAMNPDHQTEEETAMALSDAVKDMRPLLDDGFVAYLKYAVAEEEARLARAGLLDDPEHNQWLFVLQIVQQGVYAEIAKGINRYIDHIWYVLRMDTAKQRKMLLSRLIDDMPTMDVRPFVQVVENIVGALGDSSNGEFDMATELGEMTNKLLQLHRDVRELLPPERIDEKSRDADEWAARQKQRLLEARQIGKQRLQAADNLAHRQDEIDDLGRRGEMERIE